MNWLKKLTGGYSSSAKVVDGTLVISMPDAISPVVWRMDFGFAKASAIEVRDNDGLYVLVLKTPKSDVNDIAPFDSKAKAVNALMAISRAMEQGQGHIRPTAANESAPAAETTPAQAPVAAAAPAKPAQSGGKGQTLAGIVGVLILISLLVFLFKISSNGPTLRAGGTSVSSGAGTQMSQDADDTGVPVSADAFLKGR